MISSRSHLFIRGKADPELSMGNIPVGKQVLCHGHDLSNACLVICAKQRGSVRHDQALSLIFLKLRKIRCFHDNAKPAVQDNILSIISSNDLRPYIRPAYCRRGIHMGNEAHDRLSLHPFCGRNGSIYIAVLLIIGDLLCPHFCKLFHEKPGKLMLLCRSRRTCSLFI